jgi:murein DD-endopeptidase MepM/ murein hydrolase activator NlpD
MKKFLKVILIATALLITNFSNILPNNSKSIISKNIYTEPVEVLNLAKSLNISFSELKEMNSFPICSPINPKEIVRISSFYGEREHPIFKIKSFHKGIDYSALEGTLVMATANGTVKDVKRTSGYGNLIKIEHKNNYSTKYAHLCEMYVKPGDVVKVGDIIGTVGSTGISTGNHLHYEISLKNKQINPLHIYPEEVNEQNYISYFKNVNHTINYSEQF